LLSKPQDLDRLRKRNLLVEAKTLGIKNATKLKKTQLINEIDKVLKVAEEKQSSFKGFTNQFTFEPSGETTYDPESFLTAVKRTALAKIQTQTKVKIVLRAKMEKTGLKTGQSLVEEHQFRSKNEIVLESTNKNELWCLLAEQVLEDLAKFQMNGSGWTFHSIAALDIHTVGYEPLNGSSWVPLPKFLANKKAIINMKNTDNQCFKWCIARALNPAKREIEKQNTCRVSQFQRKQAESLNFKVIEFPMSLQAIDKFERLNPEISVHVFGFDSISKIYPLRISKFKRQKEIDLMLLKNKHYCLVKNLSRLMSMQASKHHGEIVICRRCLNHFLNEKALENRKENCQNHDAIKIVLPEEGSILEFKNHKHSMRVPIVVYADFESFTKPIDSCQPDPDRSITKAYQKHEPSGFCFHVKCLDNSSKPILFTKTREEENVADIFVDMLEKEFDRFSSSEVQEMILTEEEKTNFE